MKIELDREDVSKIIREHLAKIHSNDPNRFSLEFLRHVERRDEDAMVALGQFYVRVESR